MRKSILAAAAITAGLAVAAPAAKAMPVSTPGQLGLAEGAAGGVEKTVLVCDPWTCYWRPGYWGYDRPYPYDPYWVLRRHYWWGSDRPWWVWPRRW